MKPFPVSRETPPLPPAGLPASPRVLPEAKRPLFERRSLGWLIAVDALWTVPDVVGFLGAPLLIPACLVVAGAPVAMMQRRAGDSRARALAKGIFCGVLAALPFPVCGSAFGAAMLAFAGREAKGPGVG